MAPLCGNDKAKRQIGTKWSIFKRFLVELELSVNALNSNQPSSIDQYYYSIHADKRLHSAQCSFCLSVCAVLCERTRRNHKYEIRLHFDRVYFWLNEILFQK